MTLGSEEVVRYQMRAWVELSSDESMGRTFLCFLALQCIAIAIIFPEISIVKGRYILHMSICKTFSMYCRNKE